MAAARVVGPPSAISSIFERRIEVEFGVRRIDSIGPVFFGAAFPNALVKAGVCWPDLLSEMESFHASNFQPVLSAPLQALRAADCLGFRARNV